MTTSELTVRVLFALAVVIAASEVAGRVVARIGQPRVIGEILAGILLGPSLLGAVAPEVMAYLFPPEVIEALAVLAQLGLVLFMFLIGLELDTTLLRGSGRRAALISLSSVIVPASLGAAVGLVLFAHHGNGGDRTAFALFIGVAMAVSAFPVLARVLEDSGLQRTHVGVLSITCAAVDDVTAWCLLAVVVAVAQSSGSGDVVRLLVLASGFALIMLLLVRPVLARLPSTPLWLGVALALTSAFVTEQLGLHAIFGGFLAGVVLARRTGRSATIATHLQPAVKTLLLPTFFVSVGLQTRLGLLDEPLLWLIAAGVTALAIAGKLGGCLVTARALGETWHDAAVLGVLLNTRGLTELVILAVGLQLGVLSPTMFTLLVIMALVTTLMTTPLLRLLERPREVTVGPPAIDPVPAAGVVAPEVG